MRASILALPLLTFAAPAAACDFDSFPGFSHFGGGYSSQTEIDAQREQAMASARASFIRQYGLGDAPAATDAGTPDPNAGAAPVAVPDTPPPEDLAR